MIRPLRDLLLVEPIPATKMVGLIHIPDTKNSKNQTFHHLRVIAAGPKAVLAKVGDVVMASELFGDEVECDGKKYQLGRERDIVGVVA